MDNMASAPVVTHIDMTNGPVTGSASITLTGLNFGESDLTPTVRVMVTICATSSWSSMTGLVCQSPVGSGVGGLLSVRVTAAVLVGTQSGVFTFDCVCVFGCLFVCFVCCLFVCLFCLYVTPTRLCSCCCCSADGYSHGDDEWGRNWWCQYHVERC